MCTYKGDGWQILPVLLLLFSILVVMSYIVMFPVEITPPGYLLSRNELIACGCITILVFLYLIFYPRKIIVYTILSVIHGSIIIINSGNVLGFLFFYPFNSVFIQKRAYYNA